MAGIAGMGTPNSLKPPVPNEIDLSNVAQIPNFASQPAPAPAEDDSGIDPDIMAFAQGGDSEIDPEIAAFAQGAEAGVDATIAEEAEAATNPDSEAPGILSQLGTVGKDLLTEAPIDILSGKTETAKMFEGTGTRLKASFAKTDKEKRFVLDQAYGAENVKKAKGGFLIKKDGKWRKFDRDNWELVADLADLGGDAVEQGFTEGATLGGLALAGVETAGAPLTAGSSLLAVPGTIAAARVGGSVAGQFARNVIAEDVLGIPRDEERNRAVEYGVGGVTNAAAGRLGQWAGMKLAARSAEKAAEKLMTNAEAFEKNLALTKEASQVLKQSGLYTQELSLIEQVPDSAEAKALFQKIASDPAVEQVFRAKNEAFDQANRNFLDSISTFSGNKPGVGQKVGEYINQARLAEGKLIGDYRKQFLDQAGASDLPVPELTSKINQIADDLGFQVKDNQLIKPTIEQLESLGYSKEGAENLSRLVDGLNTKLFNQEGRVSGKELNGLYEQWSKLTKNLWDRGEGADKAYRKTATKIKDAIRDEYTSKIGVVLDGSDKYTKEGYQKALNEFSFIEKNRSQIEDMLDKDKISSMAFAKHIFSKGQNGLDDLRATKAVLKNRPELFGEMTGQFYTDLVRNATDEGSGRVAWNKVNKEISKLGPEMLEEMMGPNAMKQFEALQVIGSNLEKASRMGGIAGPQEASLMKNIGIAAQGGGPFAQGNAVIQSLAQFDRDKAFLTSLKKEGIDSFLKTVPKSQKGLLRRTLQGYMDLQNNVLQSPISQAAARGAASRATRPNEKEE